MNQPYILDQGFQFQTQMPTGDASTATRGASSGRGQGAKKPATVYEDEEELEYQRWKAQQ